jgi:hypothetical protein
MEQRGELGCGVEDGEEPDGREKKLGGALPNGSNACVAVEETSWSIYGFLRCSACWGWDLLR